MGQPSANDGITFDEALIKRVGQFGPGQWRCVSAASLSLIANAAGFFFWVFATISPITQHQWQCVDPHDAACQAVKQQQVPNNEAFCALPSGSTQWTSYDSLVAQFNLVCSDAWKVQFTNSLMFIGALVGSGSFGFLCDCWGRKRPLFLATAIIATSMYASLAAPSYWVMAALRVVTGLGAAGQSHCIFLLSTEPVGPGYRGLASIMALGFFIVGEFAVVLLAFLLPAWQHLLIACGSVNAVSLLLYPLVSESGRWLLSQGRTEEAAQCLHQIARANRGQVPTEQLISSRSCKNMGCDLEASEADGTTDGGSSESSDLAATAEPVRLAHMLTHPRLAIRLMILLFTAFALMLNYYGISMGAGGIPGSLYMTFSIASAAEGFALIVVAPSVDRVGRHNVVALGNLIGGAACVACAMSSGGTTQAALAAVGKFGCSAAQSVINIYIAELLPTSCRSSVLGVCSQASRVGSIAAPFLLMLGAQVALPGRSQVFIPFLVFGCLALLSGLLILTMPETLGASMPESMTDMEALLSIFTAKPWRTGCTGLLAFMFRTRARAPSPVQASTADSSTPSNIRGGARSGSDTGSHDIEPDCILVEVPACPKATSKDERGDDCQANHNNG